ncbi:DUF302 domain-containing protein [Nocardia asteroides]|uniref:DUF302 domain-containing protein n=1 Tax=Nocardia asteroides TaxID=1824 RepID=UPI0037CB13AD
MTDSALPLGLSTTLTTGFEDAVERTRQALAGQGFGVLTEIDMAATLKAKLGPPLAHRAVEIDRRIGLLLPCNVVVRRSREADTVIVEAMNPQLMVQVTGEPALAPIAAEAATRLEAAIDSLHADPS